MNVPGCCLRFRFILLKDRLNKNYYILPVSLILLAFVLTGCGMLSPFSRNPHFIYEDGALLVDGSDQPIEVINNPGAADVSYAQLLQFIREDPTDQIKYVSRGADTGEKAFVCSDFAEAVHNYAESAGIRAGYASIDWEDGQIGHAIDAFETTDQGLVYIDCTGKSLYSQIEDSEDGAAGSWDKVAYVETGKKYGVIGLDYARSPLYSYFVEYDLKWQKFREELAAYNADVKRYNQEIAGKTFRKGSPELARIENWEARLKEQEQELNALSAEIGSSRFKPLG
ncbi:MAG: hypothetical protein H6Q39_1819, partial [Chloroflexi bacterium]|nr:hypothetical protein [Chloroflexota bacterium]